MKMKSALPVVAAAFILAAANHVEAGFVLKLESYAIDGVTLLDSVTVTDQGAGDTSATVGIVSFNGTLTNWIANVTTGISKPLIGSANVAIMDLNSVNVNSTVAGILVLTLTDTGYDLPASPTGTYLATGNVGGTSNGSIEVEYFADENNAEFGMTQQIGSTLIFGSGPFSGTTSGEFNDVNPPGLFSLTQVVTITHQAGPTNSSFDSELEVIVPEPTSMAILGLGSLLAGFGVARRRRNNTVELSA